MGGFLESGKLQPAKDELRLKMKIFDNFAEIAEHTGLEEAGFGSGSGWSETDHFYYASYDDPNTRWLVTLHSINKSSSGRGWLVAYEIKDKVQTGRIALLHDGELDSAVADLAFTVARHIKVDPGNKWIIENSGEVRIRIDSYAVAVDALVMEILQSGWSDITGKNPAL